jgi:hypothetical protein
VGPLAFVPPQTAHEFDFSPDDSRMYIGDQQGYQGENSQKVLQLKDHKGNEIWPPKVLSVSPGAGHGDRRATITRKHGKPHHFLLHSDETAPVTVVANAVVGPALAPAGVGVPRGIGDSNGSNGCVPELLTPLAGAAQAYLTNIDDETKPQDVSKLTLAINDPSNCVAQEQSGVKSTIHYNEVDDPDSSTIALFGMGNAGVRIFDIRDASRPKEVGYFNPGQIVAADGSKVLDAGFAHVHYDKATGYIWWPSVTGGFWVLELEPHVRAALGLPPVATTHPDGLPARPAAVQASVFVPVTAAKAGQIRYACGFVN